MDIKQAKIDIYLSQPEIRMALDMLSLKYEFVVDELAKSILEGELQTNEASDFLVAEFGFKQAAAAELIDKVGEFVIEPFYLPAEEVGDEEKFEAAKLPVTTDKVEVKKKISKTNWRDFIKPDNLQKLKDQLTQATGGDISKVKNYLWDNLGLEKPKEAVVVLSWLAGRGELVKLWQADNRFKGILRNYLTEHYSTKQAEQFIDGQMTAGLFSLALQLILKDKLKLNQFDSAMIAIVILDSLSEDKKPVYLPLAYVDAKDNKFYWSDIKESAGELEIDL